MNEHTLLDAAPAILEASSEAIITIDNLGRIKGCNSQFLILLGLKNEDDIENQQITELFRDFDFNEPHSNKVETFKPTKLTKPSGTISTVLIKVIPVGHTTNSFKTVLIQDPEAIRRIIDHLDYLDSYDVGSGLLNKQKGTIEFDQLQASNLSGGCFIVKAQLPENREPNQTGEILKQISSYLERLAEQTLACRYSESELLFSFVTDQIPSQDAFRGIIEDLRADSLITEGNEIWLAYQEWSGSKIDVNTLVNNLRQHLIQLQASDIIEELFNQISPSTRIVFLKTLEDALNEGQLDFFIQPQINSETRHVAGGELLVRWRPTPNDIIPPSQFVDFLEHGEFGKTFLHWSIKRSAEILKQIHKECGTWIPISLNVASNYFTKEVLVDPMVECFTQEDIPFEALEIEITERVLAENPKEVLQTLHLLRDKGFPAAIDDFGTGYSSLSYLRKFPLDRLKIDRVFVTNLAENEEDRLIAVAIASLAHVLGLEIVAEGVETHTQAAFLKNIGCEYFQGYLTGKPMPVDDFIAFCKKQDSLLSQGDWSKQDIADTKVNTHHRKVTWKKSFSTDVVSVDNEHRDLIEFLNTTADRYNEDIDSVNLIETLDILATETLKHFEHEETVMLNVGYPRYEMHREKHKWLIADISKRKAELKENPEKANFDELLQYLKYWLLRHLISEDTHILRFLNKSVHERRIP